MTTARPRARGPKIWVTEEFARDFRYIVWFYDLDEAQAEEWRVCVRASPGPMMDYIATLAMALRAGYRQNAANNYVRLNAWLDDTWRKPITKYSEGEAP